MVKNAWDYKWSSASLRAGIEKDPIVTLKQILDMNSLQWKEYLGEADTEMVEEMRLKTKRGLVVGSESFIKRLEKKLNRPLKCLNPGRPKKVEEKGS